MCLSEVIPSVQRLVNRCDFSKKNDLYSCLSIYVSRNLLLFIQWYWNPISSKKNIEELIYGINEMFSVLNLIIKMFAKLSRIKIMLFSDENESILTVN